MNTAITIKVPTPTILEKQVALFNQDSDIKVAIQTLEQSKRVLIIGVYSNGLLLLKGLQAHLQKKMSNKTFAEQRAYRSLFRQLSNLIIVEVVANKLKVKKSPAIGWLKKLYPTTSNFYLTFPQVQGLNSSWQWYENGISIPVLRNKLHPYYGVYFPTRFDHLILFDNWLKRYEGAKKSAIDVGIGSGVLSFQLVQHGFQKVFGTDTNPNAIVGLVETMGETKLSRKIELSVGHLFAQWEKQTELIAFNPPWLPTSASIDRLDEAIYYNETLFPDFFKAAKERLLPGGKVVIIFSNLAQITSVTTQHPVEEELATGGRFQLEKCLKRAVKAASDKTKRDQHWRSTEEVELWILEHKQ